MEEFHGIWLWFYCSNQVINLQFHSNILTNLFDTNLSNIFFNFWYLKKNYIKSFFLFVLHNDEKFVLLKLKLICQYRFHQLKNVKLPGGPTGTTAELLKNIEAKEAHLDSLWKKRYKQMEDAFALQVRKEKNSYAYMSHLNEVWI